MPLTLFDKCPRAVTLAVLERLSLAYYCRIRVRPSLLRNAYF